MNCRRAATAAADVSAVASERSRSCSCRRVESSAVITGPSGFHTGNGARGSTQAPFTLSRYTARLSGVLRSASTTGPASVFPPVPSVHAQLWASIARENGDVRRSDDGPRSHVTPKGIGLQCGAQAVGPEPLGGPLVGPAHGRRPGETRADDVAEMLEILHHLRAVQRLVDQHAGSCGVDGRLGREGTRQRYGKETEGCLHDGHALVKRV